jgi:hypothetical protein
MHADPILLVFIAGILAGAAAVLLACVLPDLRFLFNQAAARRSARRGKDDHLFPG